VQEHQTLCTHASHTLYTCFTHALLILMSQLNRLYCSGCNCPRSIFQFPLKDGWRTAMCASCLERQALRYIGIQERREREREQGEQDIGKSTDLFTGRLTFSRAANPLLKLFTGPRTRPLSYL